MLKIIITQKNKMKQINKNNLLKFNKNKKTFSNF